MSIQLIDSHAHLADERLRDDVDGVLERARRAGVTTIVTIGTGPEDNRAVAELASRHKEVYATVGIHPHAAEQASDEAFAEIRELATHPKVVALGETGLDYYYDNAPRLAQRESFVRHLELGVELEMPVIVHAREADEDVGVLLRRYGVQTRGVLHCFAGGVELLQAALDVDWYVSFSGLITFKSYEGEELVNRVPPNRLLAETDSPYLAPVPYRGKRNEPGYVTEVVRRLAVIRGEPESEIARSTAENARRLYGFEG